MEDDDVGIGGGVERAEQRGDIESADSKALRGQYIGQEPAIDRVLVDEKDANGVWLADGGEKRGRRCLQGHDILFKSGHLKLLPLGSVLESETGRESTPRRPASRQSSAVTSDADRARAIQLPCWRTRPRAERVTYR